MKKKMDASRRKFIYNLGLAGLGITVISTTNNCNDVKAKQKTIKKQRVNSCTVLWFERHASCSQLRGMIT